MSSGPRGKRETVVCGGSRAAVGAVGRSWSGGRGRAVVVGTSDRKQEDRQPPLMLGGQEAAIVGLSILRCRCC